MYPKTIYKKNIYKTTLCALMLLTSAAYAEIATEAIQTPDRQTVAIVVIASISCARVCKLLR